MLLGCHNVETDQTDRDKEAVDQLDDDDGYDYFADVKVARRKRSTGHQDAEVVEFFPGCIQAQLAATDYSSRQWAGPVSFAVYHTNWYEEVDDTMCT